MKQCDLTKGLVFFLTIMITLFCGLMPGAWAEGISDCDDCKDMELEGCYGFSDNGKLIMPDPTNPTESITASMASVGLLCLEENGNITGFETTSLGPDFPDYFPAPVLGEILYGHYEVDPDCRGTATICIVNSQGGGIESTISFVITDKGKEIQMVTTNMEPCGNTPAAWVYRPINIVGTLKICDD